MNTTLIETETRQIHASIPDYVTVLEQYGKNKTVAKDVLAEQWLRVCLRFNRKQYFVAAVNLLFHRLVLRGKIDDALVEPDDVLNKLQYILDLYFSPELSDLILNGVAKKYKIK
jgi:hypothetical protein